jgi:hypothetical protein
MSRAVGDSLGIAHALQILARVAHDQGRLGRAQAMLDESLQLCRELAYSQGIGISLTELETLALDRGDRARARDCLMQAMAIAEDAGDFLQIARVLEERTGYSTIWGVLRTAGCGVTTLNPLPEPHHERRTRCNERHGKP